MHKLMELKEKLMNELEDYADNGKFSKDDVEAIKYTASAIDHICNIVEDAEEYSGADYYEHGGNRGRRSYTMRSYARGRGQNARRDAMGRCSREGSYGYSMAGDMAMELKELMQDAPDAQTRQDIQRIVDRLSQM